jgi:hypothetical protein
LHDLHDIFILENVSLADALWPMLDRGAPDQGVVEVALEVAVNRTAD